MTNTSVRNPAAPDAATISFGVPGNLLSTNAASVRQQIEDLLASQQLQGGLLGTFELNLRQAQMVDSVGLNLLVWLSKTLRQRQANLRLFISSAHVERTFKFTRLDQQAEILVFP